MNLSTSSTLARSLALPTLFVALALVGCGGGNDAPPPPPPPGTGVAAPVPGAPGQPAVAPPGVPGQPAAPIAAPGVPPVAPAVPVPPVAPSGGDSNFGTIALSPGFVPDPHIAAGVSGGNVDASTLNPQCRGYVSSRPDHLFVAGGQFNLVRFIVNAGSSDTTLVIRKPDGTYLCDDDGAGAGTNPAVQAMLAPGTYQVYIGSYMQGQNYPYNLAVTELPSFSVAQIPAPTGAVPGAVPAAAVPTGGAPSMANVTPGFMPDPQVLSGTAGGTMQASQMNPACRGYVTPTPNHIINATGNFSMLRLVGSAQQDTTLVVRTPAGAFLCDDDGGGNFNPLVQGAFPPGSYQVWVGSYATGQAIPYRLAVTERPQLDATGF
ncbi:MAG: hypothetical protein KC593_02135 [Myxococcales bacterium]|nr:hypothetical protein [Myxococcales bacterium]MCB9627749.1 hypothetical protein [Sandaracinaceae bacterium]